MVEALSADGTWASTRFTIDCSIKDTIRVALKTKFNLMPLTIGAEGNTKHEKAHSSNGPEIHRCK